MNETTKTIEGPNGLSIELDKKEVFPDDPGNGTPAMVYRKDNRGHILDSGTYWCAVGEGELSDKMTKLTDEEQAWLNQQLPEIEEFLYE